VVCMIEVATIRRVREPYGILGNMSAHKVTYGEIRWRTCEALFQALRFPADSPVRELIRQEVSPMGAKAVAKSRVDLMSVEPLSEADLDNMRAVLRLKYNEHASVRECLAATRDKLIVEDCTRRQRGSGLFWGAALAGDKWWGDNWLGKLWMEIRSEQRAEESQVSA